MTSVLNHLTTIPENSDRVTADTTGDPIARVVARELLEQGFTSFVAVPCGVLAPLLEQLHLRDRARGGQGVSYVPREDTALGVAVGQRLAGGRPLVLMQNSGLGQSLNALASLVLPYRIGIPMIISIRGAAPDHTAENTAMGVLTEPALRELGIPIRTLSGPGAGVDTHANGIEGGIHPGVAMARWLRLAGQDEPAAMLVRPDCFGWAAAA